MAVIDNFTYLSPLPPFQVHQLLAEKPVKSPSKLAETFRAQNGDALENVSVEKVPAPSLSSSLFSRNFGGACSPCWLVEVSPCFPYFKREG